MDDSPSVSIIIPCFNEVRTLPYVLKALSEMQYPGETEVIVVDNGSTDGTPYITRSYDVVLEHEQCKSSYLARNRGVLASQYDWIAFLDGDCVPDQDWIKNLIECACSNDADYVAGYIHFVQDHVTLANSLLAFHHSSDIQRKNVMQFSCVAGGNMLIARYVFDCLGLFLPVYSGGDIEFSKRASAVGFKLAYAEHATVCHHSDFTNVTFLKRSFRIRLGQEVSNPSITPVKHLFKCILAVPWRPGIRAVRPIADALNIQGVTMLIFLWVYLWIERWSSYFGAFSGSIKILWFDIRSKKIKSMNDNY